MDKQSKGVFPARNKHLFLNRFLSQNKVIANIDKKLLEDFLANIKKSNEDDLDLESLCQLVTLVLENLNTFLNEYKMPKVNQTDKIY